VKHYIMLFNSKLVSLLRGLILLNNHYHRGWYYVSPFPHFILHPCLKPP
jgi:hypothetical protein